MTDRDLELSGQEHERCSDFLFSGNEIRKNMNEYSENLAFIDLAAQQALIRENINAAIKPCRPWSVYYGA